ncbi:MAG: SIS domain-containing protein [Chitinophagaceae bacterium]|nr:SIS domain-containing protein [Rubrivivax sp.]
MLEQRIQQQFFESADLQYQSADTLARPIAEAALALLGAITGGGKIMVAGSGAGAALAAYLAQLFVTRFERERPPLAAMALGASPAQQLRALGVPGDVLLFIDDGEGDPAPAMSAAQDKDMTLVVLAGRGAAALNELLAETDVLITVAAERSARVAELQLLVLHCLCDAVDFQLMGEQEP